MEATYVTLLCHMTYNVIFYWLILRDDNAVLISFITKKTYTEQFWRLTYYVILPPKCTELPQHLLVKICLRNDSYVTISL